TGAGQLPAPLHRAEAVATPLTQLAVRQLVALLGKVQAVVSVPLQLPPHTEPSLVQAERPPTGAPVTAEQVPTLLARLQAAHWPVHAALQHTPSAQKPDWQAFAVEQALPRATFTRHRPALQ